MMKSINYGLVTLCSLLLWGCFSNGVNKQVIFPITVSQVDNTVSQLCEQFGSMGFVNANQQPMESKADCLGGSLEDFPISLVMPAQEAIELKVCYKSERDEIEILFSDYSSQQLSRQGQQLFQQVTAVLDQQRIKYRIQDKL